jgi:hypothetical protein
VHCSLILRPLQQLRQLRNIRSDAPRLVAREQPGRTPIAVRTGSGNRQAWYRHNGEERLIRPEHDRPIDVLVGGVVIP